MKLITLTKGYFAQVDDDRYEEISQHKWTALVTGKYVKRVYAYRRADWDNTKRRWRKCILMHRYIFGDESVPDVDHKDSDTLNNQRENLRAATRSQNLANNRRARGVTGYRGVRIDKRDGGIFAQISIDGKQTSLGKFETTERAARAYDTAAIKEFGKFAKLNFPEAALRA